MHHALLIFCLATLATWVAGIYLSESTDAIDTHFGMGEALGGMLLLSFATNLPEIAIITSAAISSHLGIAIGNILGGIAVQTVVLVLLDGLGPRSQYSLSYMASSPQLVLEGVLLIAILVIAIMGTQLPSFLIYSGFAPSDLLIVITWFVGLWLVHLGRSGLPWKQKIIKHPKRIHKPHHMASVYTVFIVSTLVTLIAGVLLQTSGSALAAHMGWTGVLFGSTILAAVTSVSEISTGLAAVKMKNYTLAYSDILGGNAFLPTLFLPASLISGVAILPQAAATDIYLACLAILLTTIYICGLIFKSKRKYFGLGVDSIIVLFVYLIGMIGLFTIT